MGAPDITLSIVSHGQNALVNQLLEDVQRVCAAATSKLVTFGIAATRPDSGFGYIERFDDRYGRE